MPPETEELREAALTGRYTLIDRTGEARARPGHNLLEIWATGPMVVAAARASEELLQDKVYASVVNCLSPGLCYRALRSKGPMHDDRDGTPTVTVIDGHPSALAWVSALKGGPSVNLGVAGFGESGEPSDLYGRFGIDAESICQSAFDVLQAQG
jgi:pyruvate dehydrogenase E1 component